MKPIIHYAGALDWLDAAGFHVSVAAGFSAYCAGPRAQRIRANGRTSYRLADVTCRACLRNLERAEKMKANGETKP
jgi:hypothetical protein